MFNIADNRIYMNDENGKMIAEVTFPNLDDNTIVIDHTFVDDSLRGQGIAAKLMLEVIDYAKSTNKKIKATCQLSLSNLIGDDGRTKTVGYETSGLRSLIFCFHIPLVYPICFRR